MEESTETRLERLIIAIASGHIDCLDGIYAEAGKRMFASAVYLTGRSGAEDVVQDSLVKIARFAKKYKKGASPMGWILTIVRNTALDYIKKTKSHAVVSTEEFYSLTSCDYSPEKRENAIVLEQAMKQLEAAERQAIYYKYYMDMTVREIASSMNLSKSTAQRLIGRAEEKLKKLLVQDGD